MGDLISRSALIEEFRKCYVSFDNTEMERSDFLMSFKSICRIINNQPTAYDKEKVVEQLEEMNVGKESCRDCKYRKECDAYQESEKCEPSDELCGQVAQCLAIKIVKAGGINE